MSTENEKQEHIPNEVALTETELAETETEAELAETETEAELAETEAELAETETEAEITETVRKEAGPTEGPFAEQTEAIANEMAWSKFQRLVKSQKDRQEDPVKYAGLGVGTKVFFCCLIALLSLGVVFTIVMHFISKNNDELPVANGGETVVSQDADTQKPGSENTAETEEGAFADGFAGAEGNSYVSTGKLSENGNGYEGREGSGAYNYGEALQKAILFYELQRSGDLPEEGRCNWRGDSGLTDGADVGIDLTGGLYDAGDHVKFNLPMAYTSSTLAWSVYEDRENYEESGQLEYLLETIRWVNDYMMKCHPEKEVFYYQVGDGNADHSWWGPAEVLPMNRPSYKVDRNNPGSTVCAGAAASLASCAVIFEETDAAYAKECLAHARELFDFAESTQSDAGYTAANGFYTSHSGFQDELAWSAAWLYIATGEDKYLSAAKNHFGQTNQDYKWMHCWDDVSLGAAYLLAQQTDEELYKNHIEKNLDYWTTGVNGERITYTPKGLAWLDSWGSLRYSTTAAFVAAVYADSSMCTPSKVKTYQDFALEQVNYALGSTGISYEIGFSEHYPQNPHHRTAQGSYSNNMNEPAVARHTLYGALVGGPDASDNYDDSVSNYVNNEVACDYNAGFVGALAHLYGTYGGKTLVDFGAVEEITEAEVFINAAINTSGADHTEVKAYVTNVSAWPARTLKNVTLRYFMDLSEVYASGGTKADVKLTTNYSQGGNAGGILPWNEEAHIYYAEIDFGDTLIYPGGQDCYRKEVQFRVTSGTDWDPSNDFSYQDIAGSNSGTLLNAPHMALYENGVLVFGSEPDEEGVDVSASEGTDKLPSQEGTGSGNNQDNNAPSGNNQDSNVPSGSNKGEAEGDGILLKVENQAASGSGSTMGMFLTVQNKGTGAIDISKLKLEYLFTADTSAKMLFWCDYSCVSGSNYETLTDTVKGSVVTLDTKKTGADSAITITSSSGTGLKAGDEWTIQLRVAAEDWGTLNFGNDYSAGGAEKILVYYDGVLISGETP